MQKHENLIEYEGLDLFQISQILRVLYQLEQDLFFDLKDLSKIKGFNKKSLIYKRLRLSKECITKEKKIAYAQCPDRYKNSLPHYGF